MSFNARQPRLTNWLVTPEGWEETHGYKHKKKHTPTNNIITRTTPNQHPTQTHRSLQQPDLNGNILEISDLGPFGDKPPPRSKNTIRCESQNINNLTERGTTSKSRQLIQRLRDPTTDVHLMQEMGLYWPKVPPQDKWHDRLSGRFHSSLACNINEPTASAVLLPGGVGVVIGPRLSPTCGQKGNDNTGLGRWSWTRMQGMRARHTTIISAYRPCTPSTPGETTAYEQHARYFGAESACPRELMLTDLAVFIQTQQAKGDIIILGMDINEDVRSRKLKKYFADLHMHEVILSRHARLSPPATCIKNDSRIPIDGIWCTTGITPVAAGYRAFGAATPLDHRALWADFKKSDLLG
jgi:hypothetical protein